VGLIVGSKMAAHVCTGMIWGRLSDSEFSGRKPVLVLGLVSSATCMLGYGFATSFAAATAWQVLEGALNGTVPMVRCVTAELNPRKG
jgi:MFS family permease